jgi:hypothetical protein
VFTYKINPGFNLLTDLYKQINNKLTLCKVFNFTGMLYKIKMKRQKNIEVEGDMPRREKWER